MRLLPLGHAFVYDGSKVEEWPWEMCSSWQSSPPKYDNETWILLLYTVHVVLLLHLILVRFNLAGHENLAFICECHWMLMYLCIYIYTWDIYLITQDIYMYIWERIPLALGSGWESLLLTVWTMLDSTSWCPLMSSEPRTKNTRKSLLRIWALIVRYRANLLLWAK